jgi:hypothetical protein
LALARVEAALAARDAGNMRLRRIESEARDVLRAVDALLASPD